MHKFWSFLRNHYSELYKGLILAVSLVVLVSFFPKEATFRYEFTQGRPWMHNDLIAPFDFAILKLPEEILAERNEIMATSDLYFDFDASVNDTRREAFIRDFGLLWEKKYGRDRANDKFRQKTLDKGLQILNSILTRGVIQPVREVEGLPPGAEISLVIQNTAEKVRLSDLYTIHSAYEKINSLLLVAGETDKDILKELLEESIIQNVFFNEKMTKTELEKKLEQVSLMRGMVQNGERIISKGELITREKYQVLESLQAEYKNRLGSRANFYMILAGQVLLVAISLTVLVFFLYFFRKDILADNKRVILILLIIIMMVFFTSTALDFGVEYIYLVPLCLVPVLVRVFFDTRLALYVYLITIILIGFLVPNSFQFMFMQLITGIITIFSIVHLSRRAQFFLTSVVVFLSYSAIYTGLVLIQEGTVSGIRLANYAMFGGSALLLLFAYPLIYIFEKTFGMVTDVTLLELSDTNSPLLRELSMRAPGTFQHSLQVANLSEECIYMIGGDALLTRTGALYHDIGKMDQPMYFIENQVTGTNPHSELSYEDSARIIIGHVIRGVEKARKKKLPEQIIDFIRTHHGTRKVDYFYVMQKKDNPDEYIDDKLFTYPGPNPFSKETSVVMMADSVEAASRSLKVIDEQTISDLVENVVNKQVDTGQFANSDITLRDIARTKKILKRKLMNIYHIRIEYPG